MMVDVNDIVGRKFGELTVLRFLERRKGYLYYLCQCSCGNTSEVQRGNLLSGNVKSCGCRQRIRINTQDIIGEKFGKLTVLRYEGVIKREGQKKGRSHYLCHCDCGKDVVVPRKQLLSGRSVTCGDCTWIEKENDYYRYHCSNGDSFIFDAEDYEFIAPKHWYLESLGYPATNICEKRQRLSRLLLDVDDDTLVDHINGDARDNRRKNLRLASHRENQGNMGMSRHNTSGYKGVSYRKERNKYRAYISVNNKYVHLGQYDNPIDAARAYDEAARFYFSEFACVNFPRPGEQGCRRNQPAEEQEERIAV